MESSSKPKIPKIKLPEELQGISFENYLKELGKIGKIEVLENLEINRLNEELAITMAEIERWLKSRRAITVEGTEVDNVITFPKRDAFTDLKEKTRAETRRELTQPSKYVKASVIKGLIAAGLMVDFFNHGPVSRELLDLASNVNGDNDIESYVKIANSFLISQLVVATGLIASSIISAIKARAQEIKTRVVSNQKVQRIIGMMAFGISQKEAQEAVRLETTMHEEKLATGSPIDSGGYFKKPKISQDDMQNLEIVRQMLEERGISYIDHKKYKG
jgi:hypothetical protein